MDENFHNLVKEEDIQLQEPQRGPKKMNPTKLMQGHTMIKMPKDKDRDRILEEEREKPASLVQRNPHKTNKTITWFFSRKF